MLGNPSQQKLLQRSKPLTEAEILNNLDKSMDSSTVDTPSKVDKTSTDERTRSFLVDTNSLLPETLTDKPVSTTI